jgi:hypothetical protein
MIPFVQISAPAIKTRTVRFMEVLQF